ncbi:MAG: ABC transporter permease [Desulfovibrio sp.]|nr:ABC transporter permease [Desulfovibrio sp.]MBI4958436.1 ABC transporter permease [Desulfovibrio sp.]
MISQADPKATCQVSLTKGTLLVAFAGAWGMCSAVPDAKEALRTLAGPPRPTSLCFDSSGLTHWDSRFLVFCRSLLAVARETGVAVDLAGLPEGAKGLLDLAEKVPERKGAAAGKRSEPLLAHVGNWCIEAWRGLPDIVEFIGDVTLACLKLVRGKAVFQASGFVGLMHQVGVEALPIVSLISLLVGLILAFVASIQLLQFGAQIYVSTIVGISMIRVMGAIMTGIIMAGRTGAAFAAEIGTMQVNEEIDALRTFGFSPTEFLVLPRMLALVLMMPLLCIYADLMGCLGGLIVGVGMLGINPLQYLTQTFNSIPLVNVFIGLVHSLVFGVLIALAGCYRGMRCGRSAMAVGQATTSAVVTGILSIVIATAIITWLCNILGV